MHSMSADIWVTMHDGREGIRNRVSSASMDGRMISMMPEIPIWLFSAVSRKMMKLHHICSDR